MKECFPFCWIYKIVLGMATSMHQGCLILMIFYFKLLKSKLWVMWLYAWETETKSIQILDKQQIFRVSVSKAIDNHSICSIVGKNEAQMLQYTFSFSCTLAIDRNNFQREIWIAQAFLWDHVKEFLSLQSIFLWIQ